MILCASLKLQDVGTEIILPCHRHADGYHILMDLGIDKKEFQITEGFMTSSGEFLDRAESYTEAIRCGQLGASARYYKGKKEEYELYSEDLY